MVGGPSRAKRINFKSGGCQLVILDAAQRIFAVLCSAIYFIEQSSPTHAYKISCQPSVAGHSVFTDYLMLVSNGKHISLIEAKQQDVTCNLQNKSSQPIMQVLREVQILFQSDPTIKSIAFGITNSLDWSFGIAEPHSEHLPNLWCLYLS